MKPSLIKFLLRLVITTLWISIFFAFLGVTYYLKPLKNEKRVLNIFSWPEILSQEIVEKFQKETGIQIIRHYYTSNEELLVKLQGSQTASYDLIIPSDYAVTKLIEQKLLQNSLQTEP